MLFELLELQGGMYLITASEASSADCRNVCERLQSNIQEGLSHGEAGSRRRIHGYNEFNISEDDPLWKKYLEQVWPIFCSTLIRTPKSPQILIFVSKIDDKQ